jgi:hypothetical protein
VIKGYVAQRQQTLQLYNSYSSAIGSISWNTGATTSVYQVKPLTAMCTTSVKAPFLSEHSISTRGPIHDLAPIN